MELDSHCLFFLSCYGDHRDLHLLTHSFPTRRSSDLPPWIALALALTFGSYGLIRKMVIVESVVGLGVEALLIAPVMLGYLLWIAHTGTMNLDRKSTRLNSSH